MTAPHSDAQARIGENLARVRGQIAAAAAESGRAADAVRLVAVTKYVGLPEIRALVAAGCAELGESRPQDLWEKAGQGDLTVHWHFVGHLQRNKVARTLPLVTMIHSVDSERLAVAIQTAATEQHLHVPVLLEVNVSGETAKHGLAPDELEPLLPKLAALDRLQIRGLMCMAGLNTEARRDFARLRELRDRLRRAGPPEVTLDELSMGMSGDFEDAIREGATIVRVGSALFEGLPQAQR